MSRGGQFFIFLLILVDIICINTSFYFANILRFGRIISIQYYILWVYINVITFVTFLSLGMYDKRLHTLKLEEIRRTFKSVTISVVLIFASITFIYYNTYFSRAIFFYFWILSACSLSVARYLFKRFEAYLIRRGIGVKQVLIVGADQTGERVRKKIVAEELLGYNFVGFLDNNSSGPHVLGNLKDLKTILKKKGIDQVFLTLPNLPKRQELYLRLICKKYGIGLSVISPIFDILNSTVTTNEFFGIPTVRLEPSRLHGINRFFKRSLDIAFSLAVIILLMPVWVIIAIMIKLDSRGPIFYKQTRVGRDGRLFKFYKFRSMRLDAESDLEKLRHLNETNGPIFKMARDPRITRVGRYLRRCSFDEIPQFINVLLGDMSVVGPRPPIPTEVSKYDDWHKKRLEIDQGITGLWQVSGRSKLSFEEMVLLDILYLENWSLWLDVTIILKTIPTILRAEGAY